MGPQNEPRVCCPHKLMSTCCDGTSTQAQLCQGWPCLQQQCRLRSPALAEAKPRQGSFQTVTKHRERPDSGGGGGTPSCARPQRVSVTQHIACNLCPSQEMVSSSRCSSTCQKPPLINRGVPGRGHRIRPKPAHKRRRPQTGSLLLLPPC